MTFQVVHQPHPKPAQSPYRLVQHETGHEAVWVNRFLDQECIRCLAETTLRSYALDLLHFLAGGSVFTKPIPSPKRHLPNRPCSNMSVSRRASPPGLRPPPLTAA
jgi:hypothetical protein